MRTGEGNLPYQGGKQMDILWNVLEIVANILIIIYILKNWKK